MQSGRAIYKNRNTGTGNGMRGVRGTRGMFTKIPGNILEDSGECYYFNIPGNVEEDSGECLKRLRGMFEKIPGNVRIVSKDFGECWQRFWRMLKKIEGFIMQLNKNRIKGYTLESRIMGGVRIIGGGRRVDIVIIINNRGVGRG